ncbi:hypothetical protein [Qipengyuania citrea]|uniref:hypothetical protein n=1 Tax=Qipengyuania citrea TaxID=225971 RepID=UPI003298C63A
MIEATPNGGFVKHHRRLTFIMTKQQNDDSGAAGAAESPASKIIAAAAGTKVENLQLCRVEQVIGTVSPDKPLDDYALTQLAAVETMAEIAPRNSIEAMLAGQMVASNDAAMECLKRAAQARMYPTDNGRDMRDALKLLAIFNRQVEVLTKLRQSDLFKNYWGLYGSDLPAPPKQSPEERREEVAKLCEEAVKRYKKAHGYEA